MYYPCVTCGGRREGHGEGGCSDVGDGDVRGGGGGDGVYDGDNGCADHLLGKK